MTDEHIIPKGQPVLVTGATGYVAGWIVKRLLDLGLTVHAAVRDPNNGKKTEHLRALAEDAPGKLVFFASDLLVDGSYAAAMEGCSTVFHTASPFALSVEDPQRDLVDPALRGTRNVLEQVNATESVRRVVLTSSCVAVFGDNSDVRKTAKGAFTEENWNTTSSLEHQPYSYSKTLAEREAWRIADAQDRWTMVSVNPHFIFGPGISPDATSQSFTTLIQLGDGTMKSGVADYGLALVDVRDVADMHMHAAFHPRASGRYLTFSQSITMPGIARVLRERYGAAYPIPTRTVPKALAWLVGPLVEKSFTRKVISRNVGIPWKGDNGKSIRDFGQRYRPVEESVVDMFEQLLQSGRLPQRR